MHIHDARGGGSTLSLEEQMIRQEATTALLPVLFPIESNGHIEDDNNIPITAEIALKRLLREKQKTQSNNDSRGRLAALILGTSVMRLHHFYNVAVSQTYFRNHANLPIPYPLDSSVISLVKANNITDNPLDISADAQQLLVKAMVDDHACYLSCISNGTLLASPSKSICDTLRLSIQYSLPHFLTSSLHLQYGFKQTEEICALMNSPGPITVRRNAIQFPGSDMNLCKWLWEEDGIKAICCNQLHGTSHNSKSPVIMSTHDGSNRYVVRNLSLSGSIIPPIGALQIILPCDYSIITTSTLERRRMNKSIWSMKGWKNGYFEVQDAGSQIIAQSLEVKPGDSVLDYCAGNGGKSFALASAIRSSHSDATSHSINDFCYSKIMCHDIVDERLRQIKGSIKRVGFTGLVDKSSDSDAVYTVHYHDSSIITIQIANTSKLDAAVNNINPHYFNAVLVDAPCSSTGVLRRRPSQRWDITETQVTEILPQLQLEILEKAATFVNPNGGKLVYSTCSLLKEENDDVARKFEQLKLGEDFKRWDFETSNVSPAANNSIDEKSALEETSLRHTLTILPSENSDGFFIARWKRITM